MSSIVHARPSSSRADAAVLGPGVWSSDVRTDLHRRRVLRRRRQEHPRHGDARRPVQVRVSLLQRLAAVPDRARRCLWIPQRRVHGQYSISLYRGSIYTPLVNQHTCTLRYQIRVSKFMINHAINL